MDLENQGLSENLVKTKGPAGVTKTDHGRISKKCTQCEYVSSLASNLRKHLRTHSGEKSNKCNQCEYACSQASNLRKHLKIHIREKQMSANNVIMHLLRLVI